MKFKTEICKFWQLNGVCEYSDSCSFAHGAHELKQKQNQPRNYKTKQCKRFHKELYCPYGPRCQFLHGEPLSSDKKQKAINTLSAQRDEVSKYSYQSLLNNVTETEGLPLWQKDLMKETAMVLDVPHSSQSALDLAKSGRLQVFEDIPESLSDSVISVD